VNRLNIKSNMSILNKELINYQDKLYWVYRRIKATSLKEGHTNDVKEYWMCDLVIKNRNDDNLLFLKEIPEVRVS
jgi:hypothetical protein